MAKNILMIWFIILIIINKGNAQTYLDNIFWVKITDDALLPQAFNESLNQIFTKHSVNYYEKAFPFAKNLELQKIHEIRFAGNIDSLIADLTTSFHGRLGAFSRHELAELKTTYDPIDYMWQLTLQDPNDWLWHLKKTQTDLAWDITKGSSDIKVAIIDYAFDISHPDLATKISPHYDPYTGVAGSSFNCNPWHGHGSAVAGCVAAETIEQGGISNGQLAAAGFKTMIIGYEASGITRQIFLQKALHASNVMGAKIITSCAGGGLFCTSDLSSGEDLIVREILDNGTSIIMPAGNGINGTHCGTNNPYNHHAFYPLHPSYDDRVIIVTGSTKNDTHESYDLNGIERTHSHYSDVDISAPGHGLITVNLSNCGTEPWPYVSANAGTSFASPIVSGMAALLLAVNPCLQPHEIELILKSTSDPIADAATFPNGVGAGRINSYKAVLKAQSYSTIIPSGQSVTWNTDRRYGGNVTIQTGATLTLSANLIMLCNNAIIIESGGTLVLEQTGQIILNDDGSLIVENGATLQLNGSNITLNGNTTDIHIQGTVNVANNVTFTFNGTGYIWFFSGNNIIFGTNSKFKLNGSGKSDLVMKLENGATVTLNTNDIEIQNGKIEYGSNSSFNASNATVLFQNVRFSGGHNAIGFKGTALSSFTMNTNSEVNNFTGTATTGIWLKNMSASATINISNSSFNGCGTAIKGENLDLVNLTNLTVQNIIYGYDFSNIRVVNANSNQITANGIEADWLAVKLNEVRGYYMDGGKISGHFVGDDFPASIRAHNSLVFMRNGAMITDGHTGIHITGTAPNIQSNAYRSMLTMGDQGCGSIINCETKISGENALMNIDAVQHAINRGTPNDIIPNRLYNYDYASVYTLDLCYKPLFTQIGTPSQPNVIHAKGNILKAGVNSSSTLAGSAPTNNMFNVKKHASGQQCSQNICVDTRCYSQCTFSKTISSCMNSCQMNSCDISQGGGCANANPTKGGIAPPGGGNGGGGHGGGGPIGGGGMPEECPAAFQLKGKTIDQIFREANMEFLTEDNSTTRSNFKDIAELTLRQDNAGNFELCRTDCIGTGPGNGNGGGGGEIIKISNPCAQLVMVAKEIHTGFSAQNKMASEKPEWEYLPELETLSELNPQNSELKIYPNPNDGQMTIEYFLPQTEGKIIISDVIGRKISEHHLAPENTVLQLTGLKIGSGVFYYQFIVNENLVKTGKITVIK